MDGQEWKSERQARILLALCPGVGPRTFQRLLERFGSAAAALAAVRRGERPGLPARSVEALQDPAGLAGRAAAARAVLERLGGRTVVLGDEDYPPRLAALDPPPPVLHWIGRADWEAPAVAVVGRRAASRRAQEWARQAGRHLGDLGVWVVSGGAYGVDAAAHMGALEAEAGGTVCVLGSGLDRPYPVRHLALFERIAEEGCLLTPFGVGTEPKAGHFLARNRLVAGLADLVVVVEALERSGSLSTARWAALQGKPVLAVPGSVGTERLLRLGASPVAEPGELAAFLAGKERRPRRDAAAAGQGPPLTGDEGRLLNVLAERPGATPGELARTVGWPVSRVAAMLAMLQVGGHVAQRAGGRYEVLGGPPVRKGEDTDTS